MAFLGSPKLQAQGLRMMVRSHTLLHRISFFRRFSYSLPIQTLLKRGFTPTIKHFNQLLMVLCQDLQFKIVLNLFSQMNSNHIKIDNLSRSIIVKVLLREQRYTEAEQFIKTQTGQSHIWDSLIQGICINQNNPGKAFSLLRDCLNINGMVPSSSTFRSLIYSFCSQGNMDCAVEVLEIMANEKIRYPFDNFVCSSVISGFCRIGKPELADEFYKHAENTGALRPNIATYTALLSAYCRLGRFNDAYNLVSIIEQNEGLAFDIVFYSSWIYDHFKLGHIEKALHKHKEILENNNVKMDIISYSILIDGFSKEGLVEKSIGFLHKMKKDGLEPNVVIYTAIMFGFCLKGKVDNAFSVFNFIEESGIIMDELAYATLLDGLCKIGDLDRAFHLLDEMEGKGIKPSIVTYNIVINGLCRVGRTSDANTYSKEWKSCADIVTYSTLLHGYTMEENLAGISEIKTRLQTSGICMDIIMCNILIKANFMAGLFEDAVAVYNGLEGMGLIANSVTYCTMIDGYCKSDRMDEALQIFDKCRRLPSSASSVSCYSSIIYGLCRCGMPEMAIDVLIEQNERGFTSDEGLYLVLIEAMFEKNGGRGVSGLVQIFSSISNDAICFLCRKGFCEDALNIYMFTEKTGDDIISEKSYYTILTAFINDGKMWLIGPTFSIFLKKYGLLHPIVLKSSVYYYLYVKNVDCAINFLCKTNVDLSTTALPSKILEELINDDRALDAYKFVMGLQCIQGLKAVDYLNIVDSLSRKGHIDKALNLCSLALENGILFSVNVYNSIIDGLCRQGCFLQALRLFNSLDDVNVIPSYITYATLIEYLAKEGELVDAKRLFDGMVLKGFKPGIRICNILVHGFFKVGLVEEAQSLLFSLDAWQLKANGFTVSAAIYGYCQIGDLEGALRFFVDFRRKEQLPSFMGFMYLLRGLFSKGRMEECRNVLREMVQTGSVLNLLKKVEMQARTESIVDVIVLLCEQGSIGEALTILEEVGSMLFPVRRSFKANGFDNPFVGSEERSKCDDDDDFHSLYKLLSSYCSNGEIERANKLVKLLPKLVKGIS
ncbi:pentatricopeptide repeat-containing protein At5g57250, mitochondrial [Impatiens glandulifera]|uniref:pentatricopeptide repeat-containing protein At5g57250, mitochondrial n=1 Tax=Impatiens glandulifera TaxID=253017 RepID=UPI001FB0E7C2|nr:pentatricopeptide repeat-containing protein At5g57250, mitochondrial [Impatiens glandulifera]XP_047321858.1 pentatricopeptide repeat-containing protein At5g57250, mitochondrial [Impatiens glandulifera]XP_047321859.1 pentatricopeptide repeat-containing protein At5g57250, mitochondrial [Impatiens glandulifera]